PGQVPMRDAAVDPDLYMRILAAWSMEGFMGSLLESHAHFFATFGKFGAAAGGRTADILAELKREAASQRIHYLEIMSSFGSSAVGAIGTDLLPSGDPWSAPYLIDKRAQVLADPRFADALASGAAFL